MYRPTKVATMVDQGVRDTPSQCKSVVEQWYKNVMTNAFLRGPSWRASSLSRRPRTVDADGVRISDMEGKIYEQERKVKGIGLQNSPQLPV